jgi:molybdopterin-guanine dinucleotide biosynthesis protein A
MSRRKMALSLLEAHLRPVEEELDRLRDQAQLHYSRAAVATTDAARQEEMRLCNDSLTRYHAIEAGCMQHLNRANAFSLGVDTPQMVDRTLAELSHC